MTNDSMREKLVAVANLLADLTGAVAEVAAEFGEVKKVTSTEEKPVPAEETGKAEESAKAPTLEEVRTVLAEISRAGKTAEMKALLGEFGASRLSDVDPGSYSALLTKAQEVRDA